MTQAAPFVSTTPYWHAELTSGWLYLLPPLASRRVLCLSSQPAQAAYQSHLFLQLTLLHDDALSGLPDPSSVSLEAQSNLNWLTTNELRTRAPARSEQFDGLLVHDPYAGLLHKGNLARIETLLAELRPWLRRGAFVYLGMRHAYALQHGLQHLLRTRAHRQLLSVGRLRRSLQAAGLAGLRVHPYLMWGKKLAEVIPPLGHIVTQNRELVRERVKEFLFGRFGARHWAPAYGLVGFIDVPEKSTIEELMDHVQAAPYTLDTAAPIIKQYLVFPGDKAIVSMGPAGRNDADVVAVLAGDALAIERRQAEERTLAALATLPAPLAQLVPRVFDHIKIGHTAAFVLNRFPGVTLDVAVRALDPVTDHALDFIARLHRHTAQPVQIDAHGYARYFGTLIEAAVIRNPWLTEPLQSWHAALRASLSGITLPIVWMHGDFKVENVLYDQHSRQLTGVIDWEHAMLPGLPLLDPLYLLMYNRMIRGTRWIQALADIQLPAKHSPKEAARLHRYMNALNLSPALVPALMAAFIAHHIGHRMHLRSDADYMPPLRKIIEAMRQLLERSAAG